MDKVLNIKCIKYGSNSFDIKKFEPVQNYNWIKPIGGLWASPYNSNWGWKQWCEDQEFEIDRLSNSFKFTFKGKAFVINGIKDSAKLPWKLMESFSLRDKSASFLFSHMIDFELLSKKYDGIFLTAKGERETRHTDKYSLYPNL